MADIEKTVKILFSGDDQLSAQVRSIAGHLDQFSEIGGRIANITQPLANAADMVLKLDAALLALVAGGIYAAVQKSGEFNQQFALISTSVDATGKDLAAYRDQILAYSTSSVKATSDINAALYTAAQAGIKWGDSLEFIGRAEQLAVANNANLNTTVDLLTGTMNAYGFSLKDVAHLNDVFFESTLIGKQTIDELGQSMGGVLGIAATSGVSFEELSAAISTLTAKGLDTAEAITAVKGVITSIISPSAEAKKAAESMGLTFSASSLQSEGFSAMLKKVMEATGGSADKMTQLFGEVRAMNGAFMLTNDSMAFFNEALTKINGATGVAEEKYKQMAATFSNQTQQLKNTLNALLVEVGSKIEPLAGDITTGLGKVFAAFAGAFQAGEFDPLFAVLERLAGKIGATLQAMARNLPEALKGLDFAGLISSFDSLGGALSRAFAAVFGEIDLTTVEGLHAALQKIIDGFTALVNVTTGIIDGLRPLFAMIGTGIEKFSEMDDESRELIGTVIGLGKAINVVSEHAGVLVGLFATMAAGNIVRVAQAFAALGASVGLVGAAVGTVALVIADFADKIINIGKPKVMDGVKQSLLGLIDTSNTYFGAQQILGKELDSVNAKYEEAVRKHKAMAAATGETSAATGELTKQIQGVPEKKDLKWSAIGIDEATKKVAAMTERIREIPEGKSVTVTARADQKQIELVAKTVREVLPDGTVSWHEVYVQQEKLATAKAALDKALPEQKKVDVSLDIARIKAEAETIQKAVEWKAKLDIAEVEAATKKMEAAFTSINTGIESTGQLMGDMFSAFTQVQGLDRGFIEEQIKSEAARRDQEFELQKQLIEKQVALMQLKIEAMNRGDQVLTVQADGLKPHLEAILWEVLEAIQLRVNEEASEFLLGIS